MTQRRNCLKTYIQPLLCYTCIIPNYILNICPYTHRYVQSQPHIKETSLCNREKLLQKNSPINIIPAPKLQGKLWKYGKKEYKIQKNREFSVRLCLLGVSEATRIKFHQCDCLSYCSIIMEPQTLVGTKTLAQLTP